LIAPWNAAFRNVLFVASDAAVPTGVPFKIPPVTAAAATAFQLNLSCTPMAIPTSWLATLPAAALIMPTAQAAICGPIAPAVK
jgi:hypothetical protein